LDEFDLLRQRGNQFAQPPRLCYSGTFHPSSIARPFLALVIVCYKTSTPTQKCGHYCPACPSASTAPARASTM